MGFVQPVQLIWLLLNLCTIAFALDVAGSSGLYLQTHSVFSSSQSPQPRPANVRPLHLLSPKQSTTLIQGHGSPTSAPTQSPLNSAPSLSVDSPHDSPFPVTKLPQDSVPPQLAETPLEQPHYSTPSLVGKDASASPPGPKSPIAATPIPTATPPETPPFELPVEAPPLVLPPPSNYKGPKNTSYMQSPPISLHYLSPPPQVGPSLALHHQLCFLQMILVHLR